MTQERIGRAKPKPIASFTRYLLAPTGEKSLALALCWSQGNPIMRTHPPISQYAILSNPQLPPPKSLLLRVPGGRKLLKKLSVPLLLGSAIEIVHILPS